MTITFQENQQLPTPGTEAYKTLQTNNDAGVSGAGSYDPTTGEVSVLSSAKGKQILDKHVAEHNADIEAANSRAQGNSNADPYQDKVKIFNSKTGAVSYADKNSSLGPDWLTADEAAATGTQIPSQKTDQYTNDEERINTAFGQLSSKTDAASADLMQSIKDIWSARIADRRSANNRSFNDARGRLLKYARYAPGGVDAILSGVEQSGLNKLDELAAKETSLLAQAHNSLANNQYKNFVQYRRDISSVRKERTSTLKSLQTTALKSQADATKQANAARTSNAVLNELAKGNKDPKQILANLNNAGGVYSAKDVADAVKNLSGDSDLSKLSGDVRDFMILRENGGKALPSSITSLPEDQQLMAYLSMKRKATTNPTGSSNKISTTEATKYGFPSEMIGMDEKEIRISLDHPEPPQWFEQLLSSRAGGNSSFTQSPGVMSSLWDQFRSEALSKINPAPKETGALSKATSYFRGTYGSSLSEDQLIQLAERVDLYVKGGMAYKDAIAQTVKDASQ